MAIDPKKYDLFRLAGLYPKELTEEEKRYPSFNTRMLAATFDLLLITIFIAPIVDYFFVQRYGLPPMSIPSASAEHGQQPHSGFALKAMFEDMQRSGYLDYWTSQMSWHLYVVMAYAMVCWHFWSATPGKLIFRLVIIDHKTEKPMGDWQSILRAFGYIISGLPFGLGFIWMGLNKQRRGFHDYIASTRVVKKSSVKKQPTSETEAARPSDSPAPSTEE